MSSVLSLEGELEKIRKEVDGKRILITGGTGSYGNELLSTLMSRFEPKNIIIVSRDELKQSVMHENLIAKGHDRDAITRQVRFFLGDIRDYERLLEAFYGVDVIFHAAALKQVPALEYNPFEAIKTNILGANNVVKAAVNCGVKKVIALSTDKAAAPVNLYGATKLCQDKLMIAANFMFQHRIRIGVVRYGNVFGSRGSVIPVFEKQAATGRITITDDRMTRFTISLREGVAFSLNCLALLQGGEIFIPKLSSYKISTIVDCYQQRDNCEVEIIGIRPGEKLHEVMVPRDEAANTLEMKDYYVIGQSAPWFKPVMAKYIEVHGGRPCDFDFEYCSGTNTAWMPIEEMRRQIGEFQSK